jgi:hypothetical protein
MRRILLIVAALCLFVPGPSLAQGWIDYASQADSFSVNFPGEPEVREIDYRTEFAITLPGRVYSYEDGPNRYSVTVVDYSDTEAKHEERLADCRALLGDGDSCNNPWSTELRGAIVQATWNLFKRDAAVTHFSYYVSDLVEGHQVQLTNVDGSRTFAAIHMHENRLYILEGTVSAGSPAPGLFQQSLAFIDEEGARIRYRSIYTNGFPPPPRFTYVLP